MNELLCLLPGLLCDAHVWTEQAAALGPGADVYIPDFRGMASLEEMARKVLDRTQGPLAVAGHSMGGRVALEIWRLAPDRVARLALLDTGAHGPRPGEESQRLDQVRRAHDEGVEFLNHDWLPPMVHPSRHADDALMAPLRAMIRRSTPQSFEGQQRALLTRRDHTDTLSDINCPTLVLCGREDAWSPPAQHQAIAAAIPGAALSIVEDSGHMSTVEQPRAVTHALAAWLGFAR